MKDEAEFLTLPKPSESLLKVIDHSRGPSFPSSRKLWREKKEIRIESRQNSEELYNYDRLTCDPFGMSNHSPGQRPLTSLYPAVEFDAIVKGREED